MLNIDINSQMEQHISPMSSNRTVILEEGDLLGKFTEYLDIFQRQNSTY